MPRTSRLVGTTPYVAWEEVDASNRSLIRVKRLDGAVWAPVGGPLNVSTGRDAYSPSLASVGGVPYVAWEEYDGSHFQVRVKRLEAGSWTAVGDSLNVSTSRDAGLPSIASVGGIAVRRIARVRWIARPDPCEAARRLHLAGGRRLPQHLRQHERRLPEHHQRWRRALRRVGWRTTGTADQIRVARLEGTGVGPGGRVAQRLRDPGRREPAHRERRRLPYVVWPEDARHGNQIYVKRLDGGHVDTLVGTALNVGHRLRAGSPDRRRRQCGVRRRGRSSGDALAGVRQALRRQQLGGARRRAERDLAPATAAYPSIATIGGVPYVSWDEYDSATSRQIRVKRLEPDIVARERDADADRGDARGSGRRFGLPLPSPSNTGRRQPSAPRRRCRPRRVPGKLDREPGRRRPDARTAYSYRAFGSDSVRQTSLGPTQTFTTLAAAGPPPAFGLITKLALSPATFVAAARGASVAAAAATGTVVTYDDSQAATTTFTVQRPTVGRRKGGGCVKARRRPPKAKRCTRYVKAGSFSHADTAGANRFRFSGRVGGRKLKPGAYRLRAVPRTSAGAGRPLPSGSASRSADAHGVAPRSPAGHHWALR